MHSNAATAVLVVIVVVLLRLDDVSAPDKSSTTVLYKWTKWQFIDKPKLQIRGTKMDVVRLLWLEW